MKTRRYYFWPIMLVLVSVFCWSYFQPQKQPSIVTHPVKVIHQTPPYWDYARAYPPELGYPTEPRKRRRIIKESIYRDGKWIEVLPAK
jgi:hypothetical protein